VHKHTSRKRETGQRSQRETELVTTLHILPAIFAIFLWQNTLESPAKFNLRSRFTIRTGCRYMTHLMASFGDRGK